jgi:hypothetical protein
VLIDLLSFPIRIWLTDLTALTHSEMVSIFSFCPFSGIVFHRVHQKFEFVFLIYGLWLTIFWTFKQGFYGDTHHLWWSQTKVWMPSTWAISYTINLLKLWFRLISKITLFLLFHIPTPNIFNYKRLLQDFGIDQYPI